eukprot:3943130-Pyramimonas_sp.AAC.1
MRDKAGAPIIIGKGGRKRSMSRIREGGRKREGGRRATRRNLRRTGGGGGGAGRGTGYGEEGWHDYG